MNVAICDDQRESLDLLSEMLKAVKRVDMVKEFIDIKQLQLAVECNEVFDVILMDIEWGMEKNGIDFASEISRVSSGTKIIYVTGYESQFIQEIFLKPSNLCGFLVKPVKFEILEAVMEQVWKKQQEEERHKLVITYKNRPMVIFNRDIVCLEGVGHKVVIHTKKETYVCYEKLEEISKRLEQHFLSCHKSFLVNMEEISRLEEHKLILMDGKEIPVSKKRYDQVRKRYFCYLGDAIKQESMEYEKKRQ